jgi:hypothetical protein
MGVGVLVGVMPMMARLTPTMSHDKGGLPVDMRVSARNVEVLSTSGLIVKTLPLWQNSRFSTTGSRTGAPAAWLCGCERFEPEQCAVKH